MFVSSRGFRIHYEVWGRGPAVVLLHGHPMWGERWVARGYVGGLEDRFRLIVPDLLGYGQSDKPYNTSAYGMSNWASDVIAVMDAQGVEHADVWGYSMGTMVAENLAVSAPDRVRSLIFGGFPPGLDLLQRRAMFPPGDVPDSWEDMFEGWPQPLVDLYKANNDLCAIQAIRASFIRDSITIADLQSSPHPTLAYIAAEDSRLDVTRHQCAALPCRLEIVPGDHIAGFSQSEQVLPLVVDHLAEAGRPVS